MLVNGTATNVGAEPWHYLYGTVRTNTTPSRIAERWKNYYSSHGWSREAYDNATAKMQPDDYATDCQGLLDAYLTYVQGEKTDINADYNYRKWCTGKGKTSEIERPYELGEAVFMANSGGKMKHIGWICGLDADGEPLVVEARGLNRALQDGFGIVGDDKRGVCHELRAETAAHRTRAVGIVE